MPRQWDPRGHAVGILAPGGWITRDATIVFDCAADETPETPGFVVEDERIWGAAKVLFLSVAPDA